MKTKIIIGFILFCSYNLFSQTVSLSTSAVPVGGALTVTWSGFSGLVNVYVAQGSNNKWKEANTSGGSSGSQLIGTDATWGVRSDYRIYTELKSNTNINKFSEYFSVNNPNIVLSSNSVVIGGGLTVSWFGYSSTINVYVAQGSNNKWKEVNTQGGANGSQWIATDATWGVRSDYRIYTELKANTNIYSYSNYFSVSVPAILPDLVATRSYMASIGTPGTELTNPKVGDIVRFNCVFRLDKANINNNFKINCYLDSNTSPYYSTTFNGAVNGSTYYLQTDKDWVVQSGSHNIRWVIDADKIISESDETNNEISKSWNIAQQFDLKATAASIVDINGLIISGLSGQTVYPKLSYSVIGQGLTSSFDVRCIVDNNVIFTKSGISNSGGSDYSITSTTGFLVTSGVHSIKWTLDYNNSLSESDETNNDAITGWTAQNIPSTPQNVQVLYQQTQNWNLITYDKSSDAIGYRIYWNTKQGVTKQNSNQYLETSDLSFGHSNVQIGSCYYYRVAAYNNSAESDLSQEVSACPTNPLSLNLISPIQNQVYTDSTIQFEWSTVANVTKYELYVDNNLGFGSCEISPINIPELKTLTNTQFAISANWLTPGITYYWKVLAILNNDTIKSTVGIFAYSPTLSTQPQWVPVYRTYNKTVIDHFYCTASNHLQTAVDNGFKYEKNEGYVSLVPFQTSDLKCIYRLYKSDITNPKASFHYYTTDDTDRDLKIIAGWSYEGITGYCYGSYHTNSVKLFHTELNQPSPDIRIDHFYTTSEIEKNNAIVHQNYTDRGFIGYVSLDADQSTVPRMESQPEVGNGINPMNGTLSNILKTSFSIPEGKLGLSFTHLYNSGAVNFTTPYNPLGAGWNHNYNVSLMVSGGMVVVFMPSEINVYDRTTLQPITKGIYNKLIRQTEKIYRLRFKNQTEYTFEMINDNDSTAVLTAITDRHNNIIRLIHDDYHRLVSVKTPTNRSLDFTYYSDENKMYLIQSVSAPLNRTIKFDYDENNNLIRFTDAKNQITNYDYGTTQFGLYLNSITYADGTKVINTFDATSKRLTSQNYISSQISNQTRISTLNNNKVTVTDENNKWIVMSYDITGNITDLMTAQGAAKYKYTDATNPTKPTEITDGKGYVTTVTYNSMGDPLTINKPLSITHKYEWNATNDLVKYTNPLNYITSFTYTNGNLTAISTPRGTTNMTYFSNGNINTVNDPLSQTITYSYDGYNNIKTISDVLGYKTQYDYDLASRITKVTDANNQVTNYTFDENDLLKSTVDALTKTTQYGYDAFNRLTAVTDARGNTSSMSFNSTTGLLDYSSDQLGRKTNYSYFENGTLKSITNRNSQAINYAYDEINRLSTITGSGISRTFTYDLNDNIVQIDDSNGSLGFTYDELNRLTSHTDFYNNQIQYGYDKADNVTQRTYKTGKTVNYTYYADNLLYTVKDWDNRTTTYTYRSDGSLDQISLPNGTYTKYTYDSAGRLIRLSNKKSDGTVICSYSYTLDGVGNHTNVIANEPLTAPALTVANLSYSYDKANRILNAGSTTFLHDSNGNMVSQNDNETNTGYIYDSENKLTGVSGTFAAIYGYDAMGYRRSATRNGISTRYILDVNGNMENVLMETDASNNPIYYYIQGNGLLYRIKASDNSVQYYHYDSRGSTVAITDQNQNITHQYTYDDFGKVTNSTEADFNPYRYVGQYGVMYESSDLYFMRARYYKPGIGRFLSEDPVWGVNLYGYVENNPLIFNDPLGKNKQICSKQRQQELRRQLMRYQAESAALDQKLIMYAAYQKIAENTADACGIIVGVGSPFLGGIYNFLTNAITIEYGLYTQNPNIIGEKITGKAYDSILSWATIGISNPYMKAAKIAIKFGISKTNKSLWGKE